ncbi:MAG: M48 family metalloprotease [Acidobacteriota bacterium]
MIPASWSAPLALFLWQVALHSSVMGLIFYVWVHRVGLPSGHTKRRLLSILLVLPLVTAAIPGRASVEFGERIAIFNSARLLAVPLPFGFHLYHLALLFGLLAIALTLWQEVWPAFRQPHATATDVPRWLITLVRARPGWEHCIVAISPLPSILLATGGLPGRPRVIVSRGAIESLSTDELDVVVAHEHAHWQSGRWFRSHGLFAVRLCQCYSPVALWVFREYCIEVEIGCDAAAVHGRDPHQLARILLRIYDATDRRDAAARAAIRKRVDVLLGGGPQDDVLSTSTVATASFVMLLVLPWLV